MTLHEDPISGDLRLVAPGRAARLGRSGGCPFCPGNEQTTPPESGRIEAGDGWSARAFPNRFPLTEAHEVLVPTPRHVTSWRELTLPELEAGLELLLRRRAALRQSGRYVHAFVNDGREAGASLPHVHAQLVSLPVGTHTHRLVHGVRGTGGDCALCELVAASDSRHLVERGLHHAIFAHPMPRLAGALLVAPLTHETTICGRPPAELAALLHRALQAVPGDAALNLWFVADESANAHWYLELQPRTAFMAGVELALGINVVAHDPLATAADARERLAQPRRD